MSAGGPPEIELAQRQFALEPVAFFAVTHFFGQRGKQIEGDIRRLKILRVPPVM